LITEDVASSSSPVAAVEPVPAPVSAVEEPVAAPVAEVEVFYILTFA
jgi:hypothetical protein